MILICETHKIIMMDTIHFRGLNCLNDQMTWYTLKKTCDGKKKLLIQRQPFRYFFPFLIIKDPGNTFFYEIDIIANRILF